MENKNILMIKHAPMNLKFTNSFYLNQISNDYDKDKVIIIDVTSRNKDKEFIKQISPFYVGPVHTNDGKTANIFENYWQFGKVFEGETIFNKFISKRKREEIKFIASDENGNPSDEWFKYRDFGYSEVIAYRRPFTGKPLYYYYINNEGKAEKLNYIQARKKIFIPTYARLIANSDSFKKLKSLVDEGKTIGLLDFDAYNYYNEDYMKFRYKKDKEKWPNLKYSEQDYLNIKTMKDVINFPGLLAGHGFIIKMLLQGDIEVTSEGEIIDHIGVLL